jgi:hypothetical protein
VHEDAGLGEGLLLEQFNQGRVRAVAVHQHRQRVLAREREVLPQHLHLTLHRRARCGGHVQPALAHGHRAAPGKQRVEPLHVRVIVLGRQHGEQLRVDAEPHLDARLLSRHLQQGFPGVRADGGDDDALEARGPRAGEHVGAVHIETRRVEMAVGVDHRKRAACGPFSQEQQREWRAPIFPRPSPPTL